MTRVASTFAFLLIAAPALAQSGPQIVIPNRPDVPIIINGIDASYAVVEGDWGLARSVHVQPTVYGGRYFEPPWVGGYFPSAGHAPAYGRLEIEPLPRRRASTDFYRSYTARSAPPGAVEPARPTELLLQGDAGAQSQNPYHRPAPRRRRY